MEGESRLVSMCMEAASQSRESVDRWRKQRRTLERLPFPLADALLRRLHHRRLLFPSLLEVFKHSVEVVDLRGDNAVDVEWMAYLGAFRCLQSLNLADCHRINSSALWALTGMNGLREVDLSRCMKVNDAAVKHLVSISTLEILRISETGLSADGVALLSSLANLSILDLGGLPVTDNAMRSLQVLSKLEYLDLWGSKITDDGARILRKFSTLSTLNLAWTSVTKLPIMPSLECLNMSNCKINSVFEGDGRKGLLSKLVFSGATFVNEAEALLHIEMSSLYFLDVSQSSLNGFSFLSLLKAVEHLDLSFSNMGDDSVEFVASVGANLRTLNLSKTRVSSTGVAILAGNVPKLQCLSLTDTPISDLALSYIGMMPSLTTIDLSHTAIQGFIPVMDAESNMIPSLAALGSLCDLESLNLEHTKVRDAALGPLSSFQKLGHLNLKSASLTDASLYFFSSLSKLRHLGICDAVLTNDGLVSFNPPAALETLDLRGCWLLTEDAVLAFSRRNPGIEVRHDFSKAPSTEQKSLHSPSPTRTTRSKGRPTNIAMSWPLSQHFVDQRLKYGREKLLELRFASSSIRGSHDDSPAVAGSSCLMGVLSFPS